MFVIDSLQTHQRKPQRIRSIGRTARKHPYPLVPPKPRRTHCRLPSLIGGFMKSKHQPQMRKTLNPAQRVPVTVILVKHQLTPRARAQSRLPRRAKFPAKTGMNSRNGFDVHSGQSDQQSHTSPIRSKIQSASLEVNTRTQDTILAAHTNIQPIPSLHRLAVFFQIRNLRRRQMKLVLVITGQLHGLTHVIF